MPPVQQRPPWDCLQLDDCHCDRHALAERSAHELIFPEGTKEMKRDYYLSFCGGTGGRAFAASDARSLSLTPARWHDRLPAAWVLPGQAWLLAGIGNGLTDQTPHAVRGDQFCMSVPEAFP